MAGRDPQNPQGAVMANDKAVELVDVVIHWFRDNRNVLTAAQQSAVITTITNILNGTNKV